MLTFIRSYTRSGCYPVPLQTQLDDFSTVGYCLSGELARGVTGIAPPLIYKHNQKRYPFLVPQGHPPAKSQISTTERSLGILFESLLLLLIGLPTIPRWVPLLPTFPSGHIRSSLKRQEHACITSSFPSTLTAYCDTAIPSLKTWVH
jgi:hypothetical protein